MRARVKWRRGGKRSWYWFWDCPCGASGFCTALPNTYNEAAVHVALEHRA